MVAAVGKEGKKECRSISEAHDRGEERTMSTIARDARHERDASERASFREIMIDDDRDDDEVLLRE